MSSKSKGSTGVRYSSERKKEIAKKRHQTMVAKYGENYKEILMKKKDKTILKKYGVDNISKLESIKEKKRNTLLKNYGVTSSVQAHKIKNFFKRKKPKFKFHFRFDKCIFCESILTVSRTKARKFVVCDNCLEKGLKPRLNKQDNDKRNKKIKQTSQSRYGVNNPNQSGIIKHKIKKNNLEKYGVEYTLQRIEVREKIKQSNIKKYGVENPFQSDEIKEKIKQSNLEKYNVENPSQSQEIKDQKIKTSLKHYGTEYPNQNPKQFEKYKKSMQDKYGCEYPYQNEKISNKMSSNIKNTFLKKNISKISEKNIELDINRYINDLSWNYSSKIEFKCLKCGYIFKSSMLLLLHFDRGCPICNPYIPSFVSKQENEIVDYIKSLGINDVIRNDRTIISGRCRELDIFIPSKNVAIEFDGLYWHSVESGKNKNYHLNKTLKCEKKNIQLIHIFEDEWTLKQEIVKAKLKEILGIKDNQLIDTSKCVIKEINLEIKNKFLEKYHIEGRVDSDINLGAFYNNKLVSVMTFSQKTKIIWELNRSCSNPKYYIPGIASQLLSYFTRNYDYKEIFSYADRRWSQGKFYEELGFKLDYITEPNCWYIKGINRIKKLEESYIRIWDCGNIKFNIRT